MSNADVLSTRMWIAEGAPTAQVQNSDGAFAELWDFYTDSASKSLYQCVGVDAENSNAQSWLPIVLRA
jgi:hypothetical protein